MLQLVLHAAGFCKVWVQVNTLAALTATRILMCIWGVEMPPALIRLLKGTAAKQMLLTRQSLSAGVQGGLDAPVAEAGGDTQHAHAQALHIMISMCENE